MANETDVQNDEVVTEQQVDQSLENVKQAILVLEDARDTVSQLLEDKNQFQLIGIQAKFNIMINQLRMQAGLGADLKIQNTADFPPVTTFMGEKLNFAKGVTEEDLSPDELEQKEFAAKVDRLQADFPSLRSPVILDSYRADTRVIRGVAKRAGLDDFKTAQINETYVDSIRAALANQEREEADRLATEAKLKVAEEEDQNA